MKYVFPRQFGLHNVFTSKTDNRETTQPFKEYVFREDEIALADKKRQCKRATFIANADNANDGPRASTKVPKRLRGAVKLIQTLQNRNKKCAYSELLTHYCSREVSDQPPTRSMARVTADPIPIIGNWGMEIQFAGA